MKCPVCGRDLIYNQKTNLYECKTAFCTCENPFTPEFAVFEANYSTLLTDNRVYGNICIAINIKNRAIMFNMDHPGPLSNKEPAYYGPILADDVDVKLNTYNEMAFSIDDPLFPGFIAKGSNRDTTYFLYRLIKSLHNIDSDDDLDVEGTKKHKN